MINIEVWPRCFKDQFTVAELFIFSSISSYYVWFFIDSRIYIEKLEYIPGCNISNILIFTPWILLHLTGLLAFILYSVTQSTISMAQSLSVFGVSLLITFVLITPYNDPSVFVSFVQ